jgi:hypothetical protein
MTTSQPHSGIQIDDNGDEIVLEGVRDTGKVKCILVFLYIGLILLSFGTALLILPCLIAANCSCYKKWRLYLTHTDIHFNPGCQYVLTPLTEISSITVVPGTNSIQIIKKHSSIYAGSNSVTISNLLKLEHVINCKEFVAAVKQEMARSEQQQL